MRKMKDSGVAWVGLMPDDWRVQRGKFILKLLNRPVKDTDDVITCFRDGEVTLRKNRRTDGFTVSVKEIGYQGIEPGDLVIHGMDGFAGSIGVSDSRGKSSPVLVVCDTKENKRYIMHYLRSMAYNDVFTALATGIRVRSCDLRWNKLAELSYILPCIEEQEKIVSIIEKYSEKIDALIANVQEQIEKLKAYKQSLITEVVTKGLDPNVPMMDSGVEWIGEIPVSWGIAKLQYCAKIRSGITLGKKYPDGAELIERPYLRVANVQNGGVVLDDLKTIEVSAEEAAQYRLSAGEVLMTEGGDRDKLGRGCVWLGQVEPCLHQNHIFALRTNKLLNPYFLSYVTASKIGRVYFDITAIKTTNLACTNSSKVLAFKLPLPSAGEQQQMVDYLDRQVDKIDKLISAKQSKIEKLEQYKRSLIYEYVTGKKEVS